MSKFIAIFLIFTIFASASLFDFKKLWSFQNYYNNQNYKEALKVLDSYSKDTPIINYNRANTLYKLGKYNEAISYYKKAHSKDVDEIDRLFNIANSYFKLNELDKAIYTYKLILKFRDDKDTKENLKLALKKKLEDLRKRKEDKKNREKKEKKSGKKDNKNKKKDEKVKKKKLTKEELLKLKKELEKEKFKRELKKMLNRSLRDKKIPVLMYKINGTNSNTKKELKPW